MNYKIFLVIGSLLTLVFFSSCDQKVQTETVLYQDGSLERNITIYDTDSGKVLSNYFGIGSSTGWQVELNDLEATDSKGNKRFDVNFRKKFNSIDDANKEMNPQGAPTVFKIKSELEKKFHWLYTYYEYKDTYISLDRLDSSHQEDFFTKEDYAFIDRLPSENESISRADELYLKRLTDKMVEECLVAAMKKEIIKALDLSMRENTADTSWISVLNQEVPEFMAEEFSECGDGNHNQSNVIENFFTKIKTPVDTVKVWAAFKRHYSDFDKRLRFMQDAGAGPYTHVIKLPWEVVSTNADSVNNGALIWEPRVVKIYLKDYTMRATARELNIIPAIIAAVVVLFVIYLFFRKSSRRVGNP